MKKNIAITALINRIAGLVISIAGIVQHMLADSIVQTGFMVRHKLAYFTIQTNVWVAILFAVLIFRTLLQYRQKKTWAVASVSPALQGALTFYITITMLGFWLLLAPTTGIPVNHFLLVNTLILHTLTPLLAIGDFLFFGIHGQLTRKHALMWLAYPAAYLPFVMLYSTTIRLPYYSFRMKGRTVDLMYPYPFLDPGVMGVWGVVGAVCILAAVFYGLARLVIALDRRLPNRKS